MNQRTLLQWTAALTIVLFCLGACNGEFAPGSDNSPLQARSGKWSGATEFGTFTFEVCQGGRKVTSYRLDYQVGNTLGTLNSEGTPEVQINEDESFDLSVAEAGVIFRGQFSKDGKKASGLWEVNIPQADTVSEEWTIER